MHASVIMTMNPPAPASSLRDGTGATDYRQFPDYQQDQDVRRIRDDDYAAHPFDSPHSEAPRDKERSKKDKKWSIGKLFRRKKKEDDSGSSSGSDEGISTRSETKRKVKKRKRHAPSVNNFDHIVIQRDGRRAKSVAKQSTKDIVDEGVLSDPSAGFINYRGRGMVQGNNDCIVSKESLRLRDDSGTRSGNASIEGSVRRGRKGRMKARVEALRNSMRKDSSSDEESQKSSTSSSMLRFRSDDSLMHNPHSRDGSLNRKTRSARMERYIKRLSRDEENQLNKEAELLQQGYSKAEVEMLTRTPTSQSSGYGTGKRENNYVNTKTENIYSNDNRQHIKSESISSFPSTHSYPSSVNFNAKINNESIHYSIPYTRNDICREPMYANQISDRRTAERQSVENDNVMCVKFPLGNVTNITRGEEKAPPVPPPRDMHRKVATPVSMFIESDHSRVRNASEDRGLHGVPNNDFQRVMRRSQERSLNPTINGLRRPLSNSEDHIAMQNNPYCNLRRPDQQRRPASVSVDTNQYGLYVNAPWRNKTAIVIKPEPVKQKEFLYYADQSPRSRRPISIQSSHTNLEKQCFSDSQSSINQQPNNTDWSQRRPRNASEFWRKIDDEECKRKSQHFYPLSRTMSDNSAPSILNSRAGMHINGTRMTRESTVPRNTINGTCSNHNGNRLTLHTTSRDTVDSSQKWKSATEYNKPDEYRQVVNPPLRTHVRHKSETPMTSFRTPSDDEKQSERRKSTNLDDALNELEAIYNSLGLGDEDLLDRAERRELMSPRSNTVSFNDCNGNDNVQLRSQPTTPLKKHPVPRRSTLPDRLKDDMAFRRLNSKDKPLTKDSPTANISYMLASPVYVPYACDDDKHSETDPQEPDIVGDDVVYRNIRQANNRIKQLEYQPPFGIPVGPVTPAPLSDYLHATPENKGRSRFVPRLSPDLVSDDLAYRALRKDNRHSSLFADEYDTRINNNYGSNDSGFSKDSPVNLKKKRAVRSLSANIFTMIQKEIDDALNMSKQATVQKAQSNSDVNKKLNMPIINCQNLESPRNKVKQRHHTVNIVVSNPNNPLYSSEKDDKYLAKPPSGDKSKSSSPSNRSPQPIKKPAKDEFQQVLSMLAQEAMDTSNKLGVALAELDKNRNNRTNAKPERISNSQARTNFLNSLSQKSSAIETDINLANVNSNIKDHKLETNKPKSFENIKGRKTEDSLLAISNQLHKVEDKLKHSFERVVNVPDESLKLSNYVSQDEKLEAEECKTMSPEIRSSPTITEAKVQEDVIIVQNTESAQCNKPIGSTPKINEQLNELNELQSFNELKEGISDLLSGISQVNDKLFKGNNSKTNDSKRNSVSISVYEDELVNKDNAESTEYNSSEELATIFNLDGKSDPNDTKDEIEKTEGDKHSELSSPRLVQSMNQQLRRFSDDSSESKDNDKPSQSNVPTVPWRTKQHNAESGDERKGVN